MKNSIRTYLVIFFIFCAVQDTSPSFDSGGQYSFKIGDLIIHAEESISNIFVSSSGRVQIGGFRTTMSYLEQFKGKNLSLRNDLLHVDGIRHDQLDKSNSETFKKTFAGLHTLKIENPSGLVEIEAHDSDQTKVAVKHSKRCRIEELLNNSSLSLVTQAQDFQVDPALYTVQVPKDCNLLVTICSALTTIAGVTGNIRVNGTTGDTKTRDTSGSLTIQSTLGNTVTKNHHGTFMRNTHSGNTRLVNSANGTQPIEIRSTSGNSFLELPDNSVSLDFSTTSGTISVTLPEMATMDLEKKFKMKLRSGEKPINISATDGDITYTQK